MSPERRYESLSLRAEGDRLVCDDEKHNHDCHFIVTAFRLMLQQMRLKDERIKELQGEILKQEVDVLFKDKN